MSRTARGHDSVGDAVEVERQSAEQALPNPETLELVTDDVRREILLTLSESGETPLSFSTLRREVGTADSSLFNYHLQQLVGELVTAENGAYELSTNGEQLILALAAVPAGL